MFHRWLNKAETIGCHISQGCVRLAQVRALSSGRPRLIVAERELPQLAEEDPAYAAVVSDVLAAMMRAAPFKGSRVVSCLPDRCTRYKTMRLAPMPHAELVQAAHWKAAAELGMKPDAFKSAILTFGTIRDGAKQKTEALVLAATMEHLERQAGILMGAGLQPVAIDASVCAVARCLGTARIGSDDAAAQRVVLDLREDQALLAIIAGTELAFVRPVGEGLAHPVQTLANLLEVTPAEARAMHDGAIAAGHAAAGQAAAGPAHWPFAHPVARVREAIADASRMYGRELARQVALSIHYYGTTFGAAPPDSGIVVSDRAIDAAALEPVTIQSGIDLASFSPTGASEFWGQLAASPTVANDPLAWVTAIGLSLYEHGLPLAKEAA